MNNSNSHSDPGIRKFLPSGPNHGIDSEQQKGETSDQSNQRSASSRIESAWALLVEELAGRPRLSRAVREIAVAILESVPGDGDQGAQSGIQAEFAAERIARASQPPTVESHSEPETEPLPHQLLESVVMHQFGLPVSETPSPAPQAEAEAPVSDLTSLRTRCELKSEACQWAIQRFKLIQARADFATQIEPHDRKLRSKAKEERTFLWMAGEHLPTSENLQAWEVLAECYSVAAEACELLGSLEDSALPGPGYEEALAMTAEAQSMLRSAAHTVGWPRDDEQQLELFRVVRSRTSEHQVYVARYMRADDVASTSSRGGLSDRITAALESVQATKSLERKRRSLMNRIRYHASQVSTSEATEHDWEVIDSALGELHKLGVPYSAIEIRDILMPVVDEIPGELEPGDALERVLSAIDEFRSNRPSGVPSAEVRRSAEVEKVRRWLNGRRIVVIGGESRQHSLAALEEAFRPSEVEWLTPREHSSIDSLLPPIARHDTAVVLLLIRWSSHSFDDVRTHCQHYGKAYVRVPGGYHPNQIAHQILGQVPVEALEV